MMRPMVENSDRGITLNKSLAWAILTALVAGGFWVGVQVTRMETGLSVLSTRQFEDRAAIQANTAQIVSLRESNQRVDQRLLNIEQTTRRTEDSLRELLRYFRSNEGETP